VLRQQVDPTQESNGSAAQNLDRLVLVRLYRSLPSILNAIAVVKPEKSGGTAAASELIGTGGLGGSVGD
jgi:hypothetical protein